MRVSRRSTCSATGLTSADRDRRKLLKIAGGCTIICVLDGASLRSPREMPRHPVAALITATDQLGRASRPDLMRLLRLSPVRIGLIMMLQLGTPAAASVASAW
jgi:hypothetical protein